ncbi:BTB/POZ protein [Rhizophagus irregularis DAOM 181602=DAOM 197198]|nr:BTB/POZ protein [Rhizophagus irregularis DAOM 181602=DAOM 197198]
MSTQFLSKLSQNYIELLDDDEYYDITIEVGEDPNVKIFRAHTSILCYRSPYLRRILASNKNRNKPENILAHIELSNISPEVFQIILKYIYGGILSLNDQDTSEIFNTLLAASELLFQEIVDYLQKYFIESKSEWMEQHFELIDNIKDSIISNIENTEYAFYNGSYVGPYFGKDLIIYSSSSDFEDYSHRYCRKNYYEKIIRDTEDLFSIEDYEVFQITKI